MGNWARSTISKLIYSVYNLKYNRKINYHSDENHY